MHPFNYCFFHQLTHTSSFQGQFVVETYLVMLLYAAIVLGMVLMTESAEAANGGGEANTVAGKSKLLAVVGLGLFSFFFSLILSIFKSKAGGYPYSFLLK